MTRLRPFVQRKELVQIGSAISSHLHSHPPDRIREALLLARSPLESLLWEAASRYLERAHEIDLTSGVRLQSCDEAVRDDVLIFRASFSFATVRTTEAVLFSRVKSGNHPAIKLGPR